MRLLDLICEQLGVKVGEKWLGTDNGLYKFDNHGNLLKYYKSHNNWYKEQYLASKIISGELKPVWKPRVGEEFYIIDLIDEDLYDVTFWSDNEINHKWLERGLVFKTKEEAIATANKMLNALKEE